jgi:hypothetical protein
VAGAPELNDAAATVVGRHRPRCCGVLPLPLLLWEPPVIGGGAPEKRRSKGGMGGRWLLYFLAIGGRF